MAQKPAPLTGEQISDLIDILTGYWDEADRNYRHTRSYAERQYYRGKREAYATARDQILALVED